MSELVKRVILTACRVAAPGPAIAQRRWVLAMLLLIIAVV